MTATLQRQPPAAARGQLSIHAFLACVFAIDVVAMLVVIAYGSVYLIEVLEAPPSYPAYSLGIYGLVKLVTAPLGGRALDRWRPRPAVLVALALSLAGIALMLAWHTPAGYLVGVATLSGGIALSWLIVFHILGVATEPLTRARLTSWMSIVSALATAVGFASGGLIGLTDYWQAAFIAGGLFIAAAGSLLYLIADVHSRVVAVRHPLPGGTARQSPSPGVAPPSRRLRWLAAANGLAHSAAIAAIGGLFGPFVLRVLDLTLLAGSLLLLPAIATGGAAMISAGRISRPGRRLRELAVAYSLSALGIAGLALLARSWWSFALLALPLGAGIGSAVPLMGASILDVSHGGEQRASILGWLFFAQGIGSVAGPVLMGLVISLAGVREALIVLALAEFAMIAMLLGSARLERL